MYHALASALQGEVNVELMKALADDDEQAKAKIAIAQAHHTLNQRLAQHRNN